jgi:hypothetical protein
VEEDVDVREGMMVRVVTEHRAEFADPIVVKAGDTVSVEDRTSGWPGWVWCVGPDGRSGWVPEAILKRQGSTATVTSTSPPP